MRVRPKGGGASKKVADLFEGKLRDIEQQSEGDISYFVALDQAVGHGLGYFRLTTEYEDDYSFTQDLLLQPVHNRFAVYVDPASTHPAVPDRGFLAGPHRTPLELVGAVHGSIARPRRFLQRRKRVVHIIMVADLTERRDDAADHKPDQVEHRITDLQDARATPLRLALGLLQTRLRRVVVRILLGADTTLVFRSHSVEVDHALRRADIP